MAEGSLIRLDRDDPEVIVLEAPSVRLSSVPTLAVAKLQVRRPDPDAWLSEVVGCAAPKPLTEIDAGAVGIAWLAPGEWLATGEEQAVAELRARCAAGAGQLGLMIDLTHGRAAFDLCGSAARDVLAAYCPLDLSEKAAPVGAALRSIFADTGVFVSRRPDRNGWPSFRLIFDQTMADYAVRMFRAAMTGTPA